MPHARSRRHLVEAMMPRRSRRCLALALILAAGVLAAGAPALGQTPKRGGILNAMLIENPPGFSIHESSTIAGVWPVAPCYSNLVIFDPLKPFETVDTVIGELAERWTWHDGQAFTAKDVKHTFDVVRESADAPAKLRINPRKDWYASVEAIETPDPHTVI